MKSPLALLLGLVVGIGKPGFEIFALPLEVLQDSLLVVVPGVDLVKVLSVPIVLEFQGVLLGFQVVDSFLEGLVLVLVEFHAFVGLGAVDLLAVLAVPRSSKFPASVSIVEGTPTAASEAGDFVFKVLELGELQVLFHEVRRVFDGASLGTVSLLGSIHEASHGASGNGLVLAVGADPLGFAGGARSVVPKAVFVAKDAVEGFVEDQGLEDGEDEVLPGGMSDVSDGIGDFEELFIEEGTFS